MSATLKLENYGTQNIRERTQLNAAVESAATTVEVVNPNNISAQYFLLVGGQGSETSELRQVSSVSGATITVPALDRAHSKYAAVTVLNANQLKVYRAANVDGTAPDDGDFSILATVSIDPDQLETVYVDSGGGEGYWYKFTYYNSASEAETALGDSSAVRGGGVGDYATLQDIREDAGFGNAHNLPDATVSMYRRRAQNEINSRLAALYVTPFDPVPDAVHEITVLMAAGWLLLKEYGEMEDGTNKEGRAKLIEGRSWLKSIYTGESTLPDAEGIETDRESGISGWPDETTATTPVDEGGSERVFRMGKRF